MSKAATYTVVPRWGKTVAERIEEMFAECDVDTIGKTKRDVCEREYCRRSRWDRSTTYEFHDGSGLELFD